MAYEELVGYLSDRAGDALRVVCWYTSADWGTIYVRDDLDRARVEDRVDFVVHQLSGRRRSSRPPLADLGPEQAMVQVREDVVIIRFATDSGGILVSLDAAVARDLHAFVVECAEQLESGALAV